MPQASWLFIKGSESIWIERLHGYALVVAGPGASREHLDFADEQALEAYQVTIAERLTDSGWFLWAFDRDRRSGRDRRLHPARNTPDRRRSLSRAP